MGKTKVECKKLDYLTETQKCVFCGTSEVDEMKYGPVYSHKNVITHYYCLLLSSNMEQNGRDSDGILGFLPNDISREVKRGSRLHCSYCRSNGATLGCAISKCKVVFHLPCGMKHSTLHQFYGEFKSFCNKHRPVQSISEKILANSSKGAMCGICYEKVIPRPVHETLWAPCCQKSAFFHRLCVQRLAVSAGYFFKCPLCNNTSLFQQTMKEFGIYIPEQDASWECVPHAYQELLVRHDTCDSPNCSCPEGRKTNFPGTRWELILCKFCGSQGIHIGCGRLKWKSPEFECDICSKAAPENTRSSRHRLLGQSGSTNVYPSLPANRFRDEEDSDVSSNDSGALTISNRRMRILSPVRELSLNPPPLSKSKKRHRNEMYEESYDHEKKRDKQMKYESSSCIVIEDDAEEKPVSRSILIDDSDDDVEFVTEPKFNFNQSNGTSLKTVDGMTIPVVQVDSKAVQARKRFRAVGDIDVDLAEVVDISIQMPGFVKKPKIPSPPPIKELVFNFPQLQPQPSTSQSAPSTSFAPPDYSRYLLVDSSTLRPEDIVPGSVVYRSMQPLMQPHPQHTQPPPQPQPQASTMPMQQQLGSSCNADTQYSDLSKHWAGSSYHFDSYTGSQHIQECTKKAPRRTVKCDSAGRRRGRHTRCDNYRLNPQVMISRLRYRISSNGHFEFIVPLENLNSVIFLKKKAAIPSRPMKKTKPASKKIPSKCKLLGKAYSRTISNTLDKLQKKFTKTTQKSQPKPTIKVKTPDCINQELTNYCNPTKVKTDEKKIKKTSKHCIHYSRKTNKKDKNYGINGEMFESANNISSTTECKKKKIKEKRLSSIEQWKFKTIDKYLTKIEVLSNFSNDINQQKSSDTFINNEQNKNVQLNFVSMKSEEHDLKDAALKIPKDEFLIKIPILYDTMFSSDKCQANTKNDENSYNIECSESSSLYNKCEQDNIVDSALNSSKTELPPINNTVFLTKFDESQDKTVKSEDKYGRSLTDSVSNYSTAPLQSETLLDNNFVLSKELLKHGYANPNMNDSVFVNNHSSPLMTGLESPAGFSTELTNVNIGNSPWNPTESSPTPSSSALENSELKPSLENITNNDPVSVNCHNSPGPKSFVEPSTNNKEHTLVSNEVNEDAINKETEGISLLNIVDTLISDVVQDVLGCTEASQNLKPCDPTSSHNDSAVKGKTDQPCDEAHQGIDETINKNICNEFNEMASPHSEMDNNCQTQVNNTLSRNQGCFPKIKIGKGIKSNVSNKKCNSGEIKLKLLNNYKCGKKLQKENVKEIQLCNKKFKLVKGMYSLDHFFAPKTKEISSTSKAASSGFCNTLKDETSVAFLPTFSSESSSQTKSEQKPLLELKLNVVSNFG